MTVKSPFLVFQDFISPLACERIVDELDAFEPDRNNEMDAIKTILKSDTAQQIIYDRLMEVMPQIEEHFGVEYKGTQSIDVEWYPEDTAGDPGCENSAFLRGKWVKVRDRDLTAVLFFSDYQDKVPFDSDYEVYGGKLEFPQHAFGFNPQRGTLIVFPSVPHFINLTTKILAGELFQARAQITTKLPYIHNPENYPGTYVDWFKEVV